MGSIGEADFAGEELATALTRGLVEGEDLSFDQFLETRHLLPRLDWAFYQLWAVLFQPSVSTTEPALPRYTPTNITGAFSLLAPLPMTTHTGYEGYQPPTLESSKISPGSHDISVVYLAQALFGHPSPCFVLFSTNSDAVAAKARTVIAAYFPCRNCFGHAEDWSGDKDHRSLSLIQLLPTFRMLRPGLPTISIPGLIDGKGESLADIVASKGSSNFPYWIGDRENQGAGIRMNPEKKIVTLVSGDKQWIGGEVERDGDGEPSKKNWEITIQDPRMDVLTLDELVDHHCEDERVPADPKELEILRERIIKDLVYEDGRIKFPEYVESVHSSDFDEDGNEIIRR
ncbi:uncharacterized protein GIQ15_04816 [Arthroderma uncinatum]|uniref:uncharacterized protein n=1 Tax=Arthroderma uncinatum TaxID=74035 RepID=UPI00144A59D1|nr:uncharacterized protein GIQ15_04816 [Arthroderma uncinatum]KAF3482057.1 hypothetical protein GIQ15_04816 [Arthroderma uncinatum]